MIYNITANHEHDCQKWYTTITSHGMPIKCTCGSKGVSKPTKIISCQVACTYFNIKKLLPFFFCYWIQNIYYAYSTSKKIVKLMKRKIISPKKARTFSRASVDIGPLGEKDDLHVSYSFCTTGIVHRLIWVVKKMQPDWKIKLENLRKWWLHL